MKLYITPQDFTYDYQNNSEINTKEIFKYCQKKIFKYFKSFSGYQIKKYLNIF